MMTPLRAILALLLLVSAALAAQAPPPPARTVISIGDHRFSPASVTVDPDAVVVFVNSDNRDHQVEADNGAFNTGKLKSGQSFQVRLSRPGTYAYSCKLHPREKGTIVVRAAR